MNDREIKLGRKKYNKLKNEKQNYLNKKKELEELKNDPSVKRFLEISKYVDKHSDKEFEDEKMKFDSFKNLASRTENSKNILVFMGFRNERDNMAIDPKKIQYAVFMDIETMELGIIKYSEYDFFCKNHQIVFITDGYTYKPSDYYMERFLKLREKYLSSLVELNQEEAIERLVR